MIKVVDFVVLLFVFLNTLLSFRKPKYGVILYFVLSFISPHIRLLGPAVPYEIAAFLPVFFSSFYVKKFKFYIRIEYILFLSYLIIGILSTFLSVLLYGANVLWIPITGVIRVFCLLLMAREFMTSYDISRALYIVIGVNMVVALLQVSVDGAIDLTYKLFSKEIGGGVLDSYMEGGFIPRATGTLVSPVNLGVISLISFSVFYHRVISGIGVVYDKIFLTASVITGIVALSKTSIIGIPLIFLVGGGFGVIRLIRCGVVFTISGIFKFGFALSTIGAIVWWLVSYLQEMGFTILRYLGFILNPLESFETRYGSGSTTLDKTIDVTMENWFAGLGFTSPYNEFLGDSTYVLVAHNIGVFSIFIFFSIYLYVAYAGVKNNGIYVLLPLLSLLLAGFALPTLFNIKGVIVIGYCLSNQRILR